MPSLTRILVLVIAVILYGSLYPWNFDFAGGPANPLTTLFQSWKLDLSRRILRDILINVLLYVPLGVAARLCIRETRPALVQIGLPVILGFVLSSSIETLQLYANRWCSMVDVITNTYGTLLGAIGAAQFKTVIDWAASHRRSVRGGDAALAVLICWLAYMLFPFFPVTARVALLQKIRVFANAPLLDLMPFVSSACAVFVAASLLKATGITTSWGPPVVAAIAGPAQFLIATRQPLPSTIFGVIAGWLAFIAVPRQHRRVATLVVVAGAIVVRGLIPFHLVFAANSFDWVPFSGLLQWEWFSATGVLLEKIFFYAAVIWAFRAVGISLRSTTLTVAAILAGIEAVQVYLPGRTPEITDPLLPVLIGYIAKTGKRSLGASPEAQAVK